ncbi:FMRFamide-related neuropeptides-like [Mya arenaria]|nr:FMRFamide-related neuropeptides-like [Mya arenaria]
MGEQWLLQMILVMLTADLCTLVSAEDSHNMDFTQLAYGIPDKRLSKFVRIGRGLSSFIRIGRNKPSENIYQGLDDGDDDFGDSDDVTDYSAFSDVIPDDYRQQDKRMSSFVRIGKNFESDEPDIYEEPEKRAGAFIRMGKFPSSAFLHRNGGRINSISRQPYYRRTGRIGHSSFIRIGKRDTTEALRKAEFENQNEISNVGDDQGKPSYYDGQQIVNDGNEQRRYIRLGKDLDGDEHGNRYDYIPMGDLPDKRMSSFVRIGREPGQMYENTDLNPFGMSKRPNSFVRIGKALEQLRNTIKKRMSSFVRIGRNPLDLMLDQDGSNNIGADSTKRSSAFVRIGKQGDALEADKRMSSFVRIGKDTRSLDYNNEQKRYGYEPPFKRMSSFVRIGKNVDGFQQVKRPSAFVRIGKTVLDDNTPVVDENKNDVFVAVKGETGTTEQAE